jgi:hypothetical protein
VRVDDILIHPRDRDLIIATHGRSLWIADDISPLEHLRAIPTQDAALFDPRPAILWKTDTQALRRATNREFKGQNPQGGTAISIWAKADVGAAKVEFLQNDKVASTMDVEIKAGMNRFQWNMRGPAPPAPAGGGGRGGRGGDPNAPGADEAVGRGARGPVGVPFVAGRGGFGGGGGGGGGGFGGGAPLGPIVEPGVYLVRITIGGQTLTSSVSVLEDIWMRPQ